MATIFFFSPSWCVFLARRQPNLFFSKEGLCEDVNHKKTIKGDYPPTELNSALFQICIFLLVVRCTFPAVLCKIAFFSFVVCTHQTIHLSFFHFSCSFAFWENENKQKKGFPVEKFRYEEKVSEYSNVREWKNVLFFKFTFFGWLFIFFLLREKLLIVGTEKKVGGGLVLLIVSDEFFFFLFVCVLRYINWC